MERETVLYADKILSFDSLTIILIFESPNIINIISKLKYESISIVFR